MDNSYITHIERDGYSLLIFGLTHSTAAGDSVDVEVRINGVRYFGTLLTPAEAQRLLDRFAQSGECGSGAYFWAIGMALIPEISETAVIAAIEAMIKEGELERIMQSGKE